MIKGLERKDLSPELFKSSKATIVMDAGIATEDNIKWLKENKYPYIVVSRKHHREFNEDEAVVVKQDNDCTVKVQKVIDSENDEVLLYCHSTRREKKEQAINDRFTLRFEEAVSKLESGLHKKGQSRVTVSVQCRNENVVHVRKSTRPELRQQKIYSALGLCSLPGGTIKTTIKKINKSSAITKIFKK